MGAALFMALCPLSALLTSELTGDEASVSPPVTFQEKFNGARHDGMKALTPREYSHHTWCTALLDDMNQSHFNRCYKLRLSILQTQSTYSTEVVT